MTRPQTNEKPELQDSTPVQEVCKGEDDLRFELKALKFSVRINAVADPLNQCNWIAQRSVYVNGERYVLTVRPYKFANAERSNTEVELAGSADELLYCVKVYGIKPADLPVALRENLQARLLAAWAALLPATITPNEIPNETRTKPV